MESRIEILVQSQRRWREAMIEAGYQLAEIEEAYAKSMHEMDGHESEVEG